MCGGMGVGSSWRDDLTRYWFLALFGVLLAVVLILTKAKVL